ncbi:MAG: phosphoribosylaminoimidazolesuccinocarboxamide synthase [Acidobacteriota bacterium]
MTDLVWQTDLPDLGPRKTGKVRDVYDLGDALLLVACDRISAFDHVLQPGVPGKGKILNQLTAWWLERLADIVPHHLIAIDVEDFPEAARRHADVLRGRSALVRKAKVVPFECVARGYLAGSAFKEYQRTGTTCGIELPAGLERASRLPEPIYTPATKVDDGHDENVDFAYLAAHVGDALADRLRQLTLELYRRGRDHAEGVGLLLADTKFEFGYHDDELILIDEVLTPDSSRYWQADAWSPGTEPVSFDKQFVRNWIEETGWDKKSTPPELPAAVIEGTLDRYVEAYRRVTGSEPAL